MSQDSTKLSRTAQGLLVVGGCDCCLSNHLQKSQSKILGHKILLKNFPYYSETIIAFASMDRNVWGIIEDLGMVADRVSCKLFVREVKLFERSRGIGDKGPVSAALLGEFALLLGVKGSL